MAKKVKICPQCKTWTVADTENCNSCGTKLIKTNYTDLFFENTTQDRIDYYINQELGTANISFNSNNTNSTENTTTNSSVSSYNQSTSQKKYNNTISSVLFITGIIDIIGGIIVGILMATTYSGDFLIGTALAYWIAFDISGCLLIGFADLLQYVKDIRDHIYKK